MGKVAKRDSSLCSSTPAESTGQMMKTTLTRKVTARNRKRDHRGEAATAG